ncbi:chitin-binding type-2 domain-containing protein [Nephila pilipes]|uniref:Chitin-binding type-2 domain-containing protein n=1 Tax=Nephila pilipes TaxID=299642 RepID=A0A8X6MT48_NEPPI|nr:chitin-binding type-2 domain-containing protein [Nephila pilipes]
MFATWISVARSFRLSFRYSSMDAEYKSILSFSYTHFDSIEGSSLSFIHKKGELSSKDKGLCASVVKRQVAADTQNDAELCKGRSPTEYFRLTADEDCRDVVRCSVQGLLALRCPSGLAFDIESQTCNWKANVKNCQQLESKSFHRNVLL